MYNDTCYGAYLHSVGAQQKESASISVTTGRVTCFTLQTHTGTCIDLCDNGQGDLLYSADPHRNLRLPQIT